MAQRSSPPDESPVTGTETVDPSFGSDRYGLVWGYVFTPGRPARPVDCDAALQSLGRDSPSKDSFVWLHFSLTNVAAERWLRQNLALPQSFHDALQEGIGSTRVELDGDALVVVIHDVLFDFSFDPGDISTVCLSVAPGLLISARPRPVRSIDRLRAAVKAGATFESTAELLAHLLQDQASVLVDIVRKVTARVDGIEDTLLRQRVPVDRAELGSLRRLLVRFQRLLAPEPSVLFRLLSRPPEWIHPRELQNLRQSAEEFSTAVADSAALVERIRLLQEELGALVSEQTNRTLFLLTLVTVLALPINLMAGLFGMNLGGIPLADSPHGFSTVVIIVLLFTGIVGLLVLRRKHW